MTLEFRRAISKNHQGYQLAWTEYFYRFSPGHQRIPEEAESALKTDA